jgi:hypothetical protein
MVQTLEAMRSPQPQILKKMPTTIIPGDNHYLAINGILTIALQLICFFIAYAFQVRPLCQASPFLIKSMHAV